MNCKLCKVLIGALALTGIFLEPATAQRRQGFVQQEVIKVAGVTTDSAVYTLSVSQKQTTRTYIDGLGRSIQSIGVQASPLQNDIIQPMAYDKLGRPVAAYLPYAGKATDTMGLYRANAVSTAQPAFYNQTTQYLIPVDTAAHANNVYESSPLQRLLKSGMVGNGFQPEDSGTQHYKTLNQRFNKSATDGNILIWNHDGTFTANNYYADNRLFVNDAKDEDNVEVLVFTDEAGHTILKRQILSTGNLDTYYIYNWAGMPMYIVPPAATAILSANSYNLKAAPLANLVFYYTYDSMGRMTSRKVPAKGTSYVIYDPMNRPVLMQDSNMHGSNKWVYTKYDVKGRAINTGTYTDATHTTPASMQSYVNTLTSNYNSQWYEKRSTSNTFQYYTNTVFPSTNLSALTYAYFDDYDVTNDGVADFTYTAQGLQNEDSVTMAQVKGMPTVVSQTTVGSGITAGTWVTKVMMYDKRGNIIQVRSNNHLYNTGIFGITDITTIVPDFMGVPQITKVAKKSSSTVTTVVQTNITYDHMYRVKTVDQYYNGSAVNHVAAYTYNEMGRVIKKGLGYVNATTWLQNVDMRYNIRGQLLSINNSKLTADGGITNADSNDQFGMTLLYDQADGNLGNTASYSGRISGVKWMTANGAGGTSYERAFRYYYDQLGRDTAAIYSERTAASNTGFTTTHGWDEDRITYDLNGNIKTLYRNSATQGAGNHTTIDNLAYTYSTANPNQLTSVADASGSSAGFVGGTGTYLYDGNGNLTNEPYKGISTIGYNVLNKTDKITFTVSANRYIDYTYDASGQLLRKRQYDNVGGVATLQNTTDYIDGFVYLTAGTGSPVLQYAPMQEGRVVYNAGTFVPTYTITDQQGNARVEFDNTGTGGALHLRQENSYYAFGLIMPGSMIATPSNDNKNLYNGGSEWQKDFGNLPDYYQTFFRNYDAALGRWVGVDPMAESAHSMTTYQYAGNNPVMFNDPLGNLLDPSKMAKPIAPTQPGDSQFNWAAMDSSGSGEGTNDPAGLGIPDDGFNAWTNEVYNNILNTPETGFHSWEDISNAAYALLTSTYGGRATGPSAGEITYFGSDKSAIDAGGAYLSLNHAWGTNGFATSLADAYDNYNANPNRTGSALYVNDRLDPSYNRAMAAMQGASGHSFAYNPSDPHGNAMSDLNGNQGNGTLEGVTIGPDMERIAKVGEIYDNAVLTARTIGLVKSAWSTIGESGALKSLGQLTGLVSVYDNLHGFAKDWKTNKVGAAWHMTKAIATTGFLVLGGEELEFSWNLISLGVDKTKLFGE